MGGFGERFGEGRGETEDLAVRRGVEIGGQTSNQKGWGEEGMEMIRGRAERRERNHGKCARSAGSKEGINEWIGWITRTIPIPVKKDINHH